MRVHVQDMHGPETGLLQDRLAGDIFFVATKSASMHADVDHTVLYVEATDRIEMLSPIFVNLEYCRS